MVIAVADVDAVQVSGAEQLEQLRFLHRVARLATTAQTWDELLETVVDETRDALHADVSSLYLLDRDGAYLTLAATNGLDRFQIGRARVPFGEGVTGRVAASRQPAVIPDIKDDPRFLWVRGIDQRRFITSMLSVPLTWNDQTVGVLNIQTERQRDFNEADVAQLGAVADLLAGIVEKGRQQREAEQRAAELKAIDEARAELIALVTHELRTPLAVVRAYTDLLAEEPPLDGRSSRDQVRRDRRSSWHEGTIGQIERLDRLVDSILASVRVVPDQPAAVEPADVEELVREVVQELAPILGRHEVVLEGSVRLHALADPPDRHIGIAWLEQRMTLVPARPDQPRHRGDHRDDQRVAAQQSVHCQQFQHRYPARGEGVRRQIVLEIERADQLRLFDDGQAQDGSRVLLPDILVVRIQVPD